MSITKGVYMTFVFLVGIVAIIFIIATTDSSKIMANTNENNSSKEEMTSTEEKTTQIEQTSTQTSVITQTVNEYKYLLSVYNGKLAIFNYDNDNQEFIKEPAQIYSVYINSLPEYDANILENGIKIKTDNELNEYLQDYTS